MLPLSTLCLLIFSVPFSVTLQFCWYRFQDYKFLGFLRCNQALEKSFSSIFNFYLRHSLKNYTHSQKLEPLSVKEYKFSITLFSSPLLLDRREPKYISHIQNPMVCLIDVPHRHSFSLWCWHTVETLICPFDVISYNLEFLEMFR